MAANYSFDLPTHHKSIIKVLGIGGGGSNAVNHMYTQGIRDVEFVVCNTDAQALQNSPIPNKLQLGVHLTEGLGAGANPEVGKAAAMESKEEIRELLSHNTKMLFLTAGMGGGTGTGAAPVIAAVAKELGVLTVGIVTMPFMFEGPKKFQAAREGLEEMKKYCDTVLAIGNDKLRLAFGNLKISQAFSKADDVLATAANSIAEIITNHNHINVDFRDVKSVMENAGTAVMGSAVSSGEGRALDATESALESPLLENRDVKGAKKILLTVSYAEEPDLDEFYEVTDLITERSGGTAEMIFGVGEDNSLEENQIRVTVIATGFDDELENTETRVFSLNKREVAPKGEKQPEPQVPSNPFDDSQSNRFEVKTQPSNPSQEQPENRIELKVEEEQTPTSKYEVIEEEDEMPAQENQYKPEPKEEEQGNMFSNQTRKIEQITEDRIKKLEELKRNINLDDEENFEETWKVPAYKRRNVKLSDQPHSSENDVSRFTLNDDKDILGNNKFLHDNVD